MKLLIQIKDHEIMKQVKKGRKGWNNSKYVYIIDHNIGWLVNLI